MKAIDLSGRVSFITGGSGQIGRTICKHMALCGARVAFSYYSQKEQAEKLKQEIETSYGQQVLALKADITDKDSLEQAKKLINQNMGKVDIIVNNAVIQYEWKEVIKQDIQSYEGQFRSSVLHNVFMAQVFVPDMIEQKYGRVIGINTECSMQAFRTQSAYISGKRGMDGVLRVLAREVGTHNITVNQVAPGWTLTDSCRDADGSEANINQDFPYIDAVPMGRRGSDEDIANAVCFLASDLAGFITGVYLPVTGGNVMPCI
ncbi:MAG: SDR family oxidoreductase [Actinomycetia bacterium]|nr:SDR family oxidoreductase [Actinomycetes bacterium]